MEEPFLSLKPGFRQRIRKFLSNQAVRLVVIGGAFLVVIAIISLMFWHQKFIANKFINYAPVDSVYYISLRNSFWPWQNTALIDSPAAKFFSEEIRQQVFPLATQAGLVAVPIDGALEQIYYFYLKDATQGQSLVNSYKFSEVVDGKIFIIADTQQSLFKAREVYQGNLQSLASQVDQNLMGKSSLNYYLNTNNIKSYLSPQDDIFSKIFTYLSSQDFYLVANKSRDHWRFNFTNEFFDLTSSSKVIESLPEDFSLYIPGVNLNSIISLWQSIDQKLAYNLNQNNKVLETIYKFYDAKKVKNLFNQNSDLIIFDQADNFLGFDYILALPSFTSQQLVAFEELLKIILAQKLPSQVSYILPDGSQVTELLANTDRWQWQDIDGIRYLSEPKLNFNINYQVKDGKLFISSSQELLGRFWSGSNVDLVRLTSRCGFSVSNSIGLILNNSFQFSSILPEGILVLSQKSDSRLGGCIF